MGAEIGEDIIRRYYDYLDNNQQHLLVDLYREESIMARLDNGELAEEAHSVEDIAAIIMNWEYSDFEYKCHAWQSWSGGVLVSLIGSLRQVGFIGIRKFAQTLIVAPYHDNTFFIRNDVLSFTGVEYESNSSFSDGDIDNDFDTNSLGTVEDNDVAASQQVPKESDNFLESQVPNNCGACDESKTSVEIDSLTGFPNSLGSGSTAEQS